MLARDRFRQYLSREEAEVLVDAIEAVSDLIPDPEPVLSVSADPDDDYLIALARRESVDAIISGDSDLVVDGGPPVLSPGDVLRRLLFGPSERQTLVRALWNLRLRIREATDEPEAPELAAFLEIAQAVAGKLGGDPDGPLLLPELAERRVDVRGLSRSERTACAYALQLERQMTGAVNAEHVDEVEKLSPIFAIIDHYTAMERLLSS